MYCECSRRIPENDQPSIKTGLFRADAARNMDTLLRVAMVVFETSGVDPPVREIADRAGLGVGTVYRHVHSNSQLIVAVLETQIDACAEAVADLGRKYEPGEALERWTQRHGDFLATGASSPVLSIGAMPGLRPAAYQMIVWISKSGTRNRSYPSSIALRRLKT
jgi:AcrR family transcriptional regulator